MFTFAQLFLVFRSEYTIVHLYLHCRKKQVPFSMAIGNVELMLECFPKHSRMGTERTKSDKETDEEGKKRGVSMKISKAGTKKKS